MKDACCRCVARGIEAATCYGYMPGAPQYRNVKFCLYSESTCAVFTRAQHPETAFSRYALLSSVTDIASSSGCGTTRGNRESGERPFSVHPIYAESICIKARADRVRDADVVHAWNRRAALIDMKIGQSCQCYFQAESGVTAASWWRAASLPRFQRPP
jgi:hypothetical protein